MFTDHKALPALLLAAAVAISAPACAAQRGPYYRGPQGPRVVEDRAYDIGYRQGFEDGRDDARRGRAFDYSRHGEYRSADEGYRGGNRNGYRRLYQDGFVAGYDDAYRQFARDSRRGRDGRLGSQFPDYGRNSPQNGRYRSPAGQNGYRDGYAQGRDDARDGDRYDPVRAKRYREGDHDYNGRYGSRDEYKREYRNAFQQGYDQGYRETRR